MDRRQYALKARAGNWLGLACLFTFLACIIANLAPGYWPVAFAFYGVACFFWGRSREATIQAKTSTN